MGRDAKVWGLSVRTTDFNPLSPHGERPGHGHLRPAAGHFNPLSPHGERHKKKFAVTIFKNFNPLSPHGERHAIAGPLMRCRYFNPLSPHGERLLVRVADVPRYIISIHSPCMGRDQGFAGRADARLISIHSPCMGRDSKRTQLFEEKNWRICTTLYLFASKGVLPADKKTF